MVVLDIKGVIVGAKEGLEDVQRLLAAVASHPTAPAIYRGHGDADWRAVPTAFRKAGFGITSPLEMRRWKAMAGRFVDRSLTDLEWLGLAQHYGVHTPLLDWTTNPLVALFFACQPAKDKFGVFSKSGAVLRVSQEYLPNASEEKSFDPFQPWVGPPMLLRGYTINKRSMAQDSVMTLHCEGNSVMLPGFEPNIMIVEAERKNSILDALKIFGISNERIYADINTAARDFQERLERAAPIVE